MTVEFKEGAYDPARWGLGRYLDDGLYAIDFIGRMTAQRGAHGHLSQYEHAIVVDQVISLRKIRGEE